MKITVPATSANLGPGFDSVGLAVSKYLTIEVLEARDQWQVQHELGAGVPTDEKNLLVATALQVEPSLQPHKLVMTSNIPLARGLGSSSSVIVAGIELANQLGQLQLTDADKLAWATRIEGHPDNVAPALFGNLVVSSYVNDEVQHLVADFPACQLIAFIPSYELKTSDSRGVLPDSLAYSEAVAASSIANMALAGLLTGDLKLAGQAMESDLFHEPFRQALVKEFGLVKEIATAGGAYATYLSGAGPTIMVLAAEEAAPAIYQKLQAQDLEGELVQLTVDRQGVRVED